MAPLNVFLVEDRLPIRHRLSSALEDLVAAQVIGHADAENEAVRWLDHHEGEWDLAVVDLFLKQGSGLGVVRRTRARPGSQKVAVLTNHANEATRQLCLQAGADRVFDKSVELEQFFDFCRSLRQERASTDHAP